MTKHEKGVLFPAYLFSYAHQLDSHHNSKRILLFKNIFCCNFAWKLFHCSPGIAVDIKLMKQKNNLNEKIR